MEYQKFGQTIVLRIQRGEEILATLQELAQAEGIKLATVQAIGACDRATIGMYEVEKQEYFSTQLQEEMELTSLLGNITTMDGQYYGHFHATFGLEDGSVVGGHLNEAWISATCEVFIQVIDGEVDRFKDSETGLNLIKL